MAWVQKHCLRCLVCCRNEPWRLVRTRSLNPQDKVYSEIQHLCSRVSHLKSWRIRRSCIILGGGGVLKKFLYREAPPRGPTPYPFVYHFSRKRYAFHIPSVGKWYPFHIPCLELCISFICCKCTVGKLLRWGNPPVHIIFQVNLITFSWSVAGDHMRDYMDTRVTPPKRVNSPTWGPPPPCKQAPRWRLISWEAWMFFFVCRWMGL